MPQPTGVAPTVTSSGVTRDTRVQVLRQANRAAVLRHIVMAGETSRARVGQECQLSVGSVTNVVSGLLIEGLVEESGSVPSAGGRPTSLLRPRPQGAYFIGADVGEEGVAVELFDLALTRVDREFARAVGGAGDVEGISGALRQAVGRIWERHPDKRSTIAGIGLGLPGIVETEPSGQQTLHAQSLGWPGITVRDLLDLPAVAGLPLYAENGAKTLAAGENAFGAARGATQAVVALLGRGVGLGVLVGGHILRGRVSSAAEWGHTKISLGGRMCTCGGRGCLQAYIGADAILARWHEAGGEPLGHGWTALSALVSGADDGDPVARRVVDETVEILGLGLGNLVNLYNPERVVIGGWVGLKLMEGHAAAVEQASRIASLTRPGSQYTVHPCTFGGDSVALGAALLPLERLIDPPAVLPVSTPLAVGARHLADVDGFVQHPVSPPSKEMS